MYIFSKENQRIKKLKDALKLFSLNQNGVNLFFIKPQKDFSFSLKRFGAVFCGPTREPYCCDINFIIH